MAGFFRQLFGLSPTEAEPTPKQTQAVQKRAAALDEPALALSWSGFGALGSLGYLPNPDEVLATQGGQEGIAFYRRVRRQIPYVAGLFKMRIDAVSALPHAWIAGDPDNDDSVMLKRIIDDAWNNLENADAAMRKLMLCIADGVSFGELVWQFYTATVKAVPPPPPPTRPAVAPPPPPQPAVLKISSPALNAAKAQMAEFVAGLPPLGELPDTDTLNEATEDAVATVDMLVPQLIDRRPEHFFFDLQGDVHFRSSGQAYGTQKLDKLQVIVGRYGSAEIWGDGEMRECYADIWKLDTIDKMALRALEKQGYPLLRILVPESWDQDRIRAIRNAITATYPNFVVIPFGDQYIENFIDTTQSPTYLGRDQIDRITKLHDTISISVLGVSFSNSDKGSRARDQVRNELRFEKTANDGSTYDALRDAWAQRVCSVNFPSIPQNLWPRSQTDTKPTGDLTAWMTSVTAAAALKFPISRKQVSEKMGLDMALSEEDTLNAPAPVPPQLGGPPAAPPDAKKPEPNKLPSMGGKTPASPSDAVTVMSEDGMVYTFKNAAEFSAATGL